LDVKNELKKCCTEISGLREESLRDEIKSTESKILKVVIQTHEDTKACLEALNMGEKGFC
jgi:hypothetical protein